MLEESMTENAENMTEFRENYVKWRDTYGLLSAYVTELREVILKASRHDWLTVAQRDELLGLVQEIDAERRAIEATGVAPQRADAHR